MFVSKIPSCFCFRVYPFICTVRVSLVDFFFSSPSGAHIGWSFLLFCYFFRPLSIVCQTNKIPTGNKRSTRFTLYAAFMAVTACLLIFDFHMEKTYLSNTAAVSYHHVPIQFSPGHSRKGGVDDGGHWSVVPNGGARWRWRQ